MNKERDILILGIESSCDDTSASVIKNGYLLSNIIAGDDDMKTKMLSICILISAILISLSIAFSATFNFLAGAYDRYDFYVDGSRHTVYTFDKYTGDYAKNIILKDMSGNWNDMR